MSQLLSRGAYRFLLASYHRVVRCSNSLIRRSPRGPGVIYQFMPSPLLLRNFLGLVILITVALIYHRTDNFSFRDVKK